MKTALTLAVLAAAIAVGLDQLADATQTRDDRYRPGSRSEIVLVVHTRQPFRTPAQSADAVWGACQGTIGHRLLPPGLTEATPGQFHFVVTPSLGRHARQRLRGCIEDTTLDR